MASPSTTPAMLSPPTSTTSSTAAHLYSGIALLDSCNTVTTHIDRLVCRRRLLRFAHHLLSSPSLSLDSPRRAHEAIVERDRSPTHAINDFAGKLAKSLAPTNTPCDKISSVRQTIYAMEAISSLVFGTIVAVPGGGEKADLAGIKISDEFPWAEAFNKVSAAFNKVSAAVSGELEKGFAEEVEAVEASVGRLAGERRWRRCKGIVHEDVPNANVIG